MAEFGVGISQRQDSRSLSGEFNTIVVLTEELMLGNWLVVPIRELGPAMIEAMIIVIVLLHIHLLGKDRYPWTLVADVFRVELLP